jgi:hypothetical protein
VHELGWRVLFLLPDGIPSVEVVTNDGRTNTTAVKNNVVSVVLAAKPSTMTFRAPDGSQQSLDLSQIG